MIKQNKYMRFMASLAETNLISKVAVSSFVFASCGQGLTDEQKATLDSLEGKATFTAEEKKEYDDLKKKKDQFATIQNLSTEMVNYFKTGEAGDAALKTIVSTALGGSIDGGSIADNTLVAAKIQNNAVITDKIANSAVTDAKIGANAVTEAKIQNSAVTTDKIADLNVTRAKIQDDAVTEAKIQNNAVTTDKIANGAVTIVKINNTELEDLIANMIIKSTKPIHGLRSKV